MKKVCMTMAGIILACVSFTASAQTGNFSININGGAGISSLRNDLDYDLEYSGEIQARYQLSNIFSVSLGAGYEQIGVREQITYYDQFMHPMYMYATRISFDYISIPLLLRAETGNKTKYFVNAGPGFGYLLNNTYHFSDQHDDALYSAPNYNTYKKVNAFVCFGAGAKIPLGDKTSFSMEVRDNFGLLDISESGQTSPKTHSVHLRAGLDFAL